MSELMARSYNNSGNFPLVEMLKPPFYSVLDIGCGAGDNARLILDRYPETRIEGITISEPERQAALLIMHHCWMFDIEQDIPEEIVGARFDALIFSHVLEHTRQPAVVLARFLDLLVPGGIVLIAVPNVLNWRQRVQFLLGHFEYESAGILDDTHLRFFTWFTADKYLLARSPNLAIVEKRVTGSVPLYWLRRHFLPISWSERIDNLGCKYWPNLFGGQVLIKAVKIE